MSQKLRKIRGFWDILVVVLRRKYPCRKSPLSEGMMISDTKIFYIRSKKR